ncbi:copper homeostasis membrane protein CopD [Pseudomonas guariconensis]|uniref:copper homeostasis membrane protein CopD n=1 Tax=Pseudomonas guariconensis TaxID=1288410 RepID=UPI0018AA935E|nr:copper homeostasis membrane protein CopD [Pseudomonas guariconensis]MBF8757271.1 copper homeostasis membrane protein CopD [Pseudomonas guariconensis]
MDSAIIVCRFVHFSIVLVMFGACLLRPLLLGSNSGAVAYLFLDQALDRALRLLALLSLISGLGWLMVTAASMADSWRAAVDVQAVLQVLGSTFFGRVWAAHLIASLVLFVCLCLNPRPAFNLRIILSGVVLASLAPVGHVAMFDGISGQLLIVNQVIHLLCVGTWLGGLTLLLMVLMQRDPQDARQVLHRFSTIGYCLVAGIILTGLINVRVLSGAYWPTPLFTGFALILLIKASLVMAMLLLALFNRLNARSGRIPVLRTSILVEWFCGVAAVAAVSLLGTLPPTPLN